MENVLTKEERSRLAKLFASIGGRSKSKKKREASRENGKLGGRPRNKKK